MEETENLEGDELTKYIKEHKLHADGDAGWYETSFGEKSIFGTNLIEINGNVPYNASDWLIANLRNLPFFNKLKMEEDSP